MPKRLKIVSIVSLLAVTTLVPLQVYAQSTSSEDCGSNSISRGIWAGFNAVFGTSEPCETTNADDQNQSTPPADEPSASEPTPVEPTETGRTYYALGDSIAAGAGLGAQRLGGSSCMVSDEAYPALVAAERGMTYENYACSGATAGDLLTEQHLPNTSRDVEPQLYTALDNGMPDVITITAGANDMYWENYLRYCYQYECGKTVDSVAIAGLRATVRAKLEAVLASIYAQSDGSMPTVVITGYFMPISAECAELQSGLTSTEISWLTRQVNSLNSTIRRATTSYDSVEFASLNFSGHQLCSGDSWIQDLNDPAPFHPTAQGHQAIAESVLQYVD